MRRPARALPGLLAVLLSAVMVACGGERTDVAVAEVVAAAPADLAVPPRDADLAPAGWPGTAAWIQRETQAGRPVVVNVFASWCGPCEEEAPVFRRVALERTDIAFLGVDHQDLLEKGRAFVDEQRLPFPTVFDVGGEVARGVGSTGMPTTAFFDLDGRLVDLHVGPLTEPELRQRLERLAPDATTRR